MKLDFIIVGLGLAGLSFVEQLIQSKKKFVVFEDHSQCSSLVAGGVYNPVVLKRFTPVWNGNEQLEKAIPFYKSLEKKLGKQLLIPFKTKKVFKSIEDQNNWFSACDKPLVSKFMLPTIENKKPHGVIANYGMGTVQFTGRVDTETLVTSYRNSLADTSEIIFEKFNYSQLDATEDSVHYKGFESDYIVFCEGYGIQKNPYFKDLPLKEAKGELLTIHAPDLEIDFLLKSTVFVLPIGDHYFKVGATFNWKDKTSVPSNEGRIELIDKLKKVLTVPYTIVNQSAGIRPTVKDRRPLVGVHKKYKRMAVLNGLGTRGVMIAPTISEALFNHLEKGTALDSEIDINRFES